MCSNIGIQYFINIFTISLTLKLSCVVTTLPQCYVTGQQQQQQQQQQFCTRKFSLSENFAAFYDIVG